MMMHENSKTNNEAFLTMCRAVENEHFTSSNNSDMQEKHEE